MKDRKVATRYARALLATLSDDSSKEQADSFLTALAEAMHESAEFRTLMLDPAVARSVRTDLLVALAQQHGMSQVVTNFLRTVVDHNRADSLPSIAAVCREEREAEAGIVPAVITTAFPLTDDLKERAKAALERAFGKRVRLSSTTDPRLIGGAVTRVGSTLYDGSLRTQLDRLREKMTQE